MLTSRERWFADVLQAGLETRVLVEPEILVHVTPSVLSKTMPRDVLVRMFDTALTAGTLSPEAVITTVTPELIAEFVSAELVWECIVAAAERAPIAKGFAKDRGSTMSQDEKNAREFLRRAVESALKTKVLTSAHLVRHVDAKVLVHSLPDDLTAQLIESGLAAGRMNPDLVIDILGVEPITTYAPTNVIWECLAEVGEGLVLKDEKQPAAVTIPPLTTAPAAATPVPATGSAPTSKPEVVEGDNKAIAKRIMMDYMDDDMVSLQVTVDEPTTVGEVPPKPADTKAKPVAEKS